MRRISLALLLAVVGVGVFAAADALVPEEVPVTTAVELHGDAPEEGPPPSGFFIVPPRVVDFREVDRPPARLEDEVDDDLTADDEPPDDIDDDRPGSDDSDDVDDSIDDADDSLDDEDDSDD